MIIPSKKIGCPAQIYIVQIAKFPGYTVCTYDFSITEQIPYLFKDLFLKTLLH